MTRLHRHLNTLAWITRCDFKLRDQGTFLGFLWTLLNPVMMFLVLYLVFNSWFGKFIDHYPIYLILGIIHWNFFSLATSNTVTIFERKRHLLKSFPLPSVIIPASAVLTVFTSYVVEAIIVLIICGLSIGLTISGIVWFFLLLILHLIFVLGICFLLANAFIFIRDISHLWNIALRIGFFVTPVFYPLSVIEPPKLAILKLNPLYHLFNSSRQAVLEGTVPFDVGFLYVVGISLVLLLVASRLYRRNQELLVERL